VSVAEPSSRPGRDLRAALRGVRAVLLDMDGVLVSRGQAVEGAGEAIRRLRAAGIPFRIITNTSLAARARLGARLREGGIEIADDEIVTALSATITHLDAEMPGAAVYLLGSRDAPLELASSTIRIVSDEDADGGAHVDAVVIGDSEDRLTYENLNRAFRRIRDGAAFIAMHRNPWWLTPSGPTLDSGAMVVALEYATGRRATVAGKPEPTIFREAAAELGRTLASRHDASEPRRRLRRDDILMVGDDLRTDLAPARRLGIRTVLVLTGRHGAPELDSARRRPRGFVPDAVAPSVREVMRALVREDAR
jgi:HAD superfamily hydrolase (TIGR01450 family)